MKTSGLMFLLTGLAVLVFSTAPSVSQEAGAISWRLENTFRFFKDPADTKRHRDIFDALSSDERKQPVLSIERRLATETGGRGWSEKMLGAAGGMGSRIAQETCWFQNRTCSDYVKPKSHKVLAKVPGVTAPCVWRDGSKEIAKSANCETEVSISVPYPAGLKVTVETEGRLIEPDPIKVVDKLVVSLGDSFASGEGNPDVPVRFDPKKILDYGTDNYARGFPVREGVRLGPSSQPTTTANPQFQKARAGWVHRGCRRSLYSQHLRLALQLALEDPKQQQAITFVGLACTGGEIVEGLFLPWRGTEQTAPGELTTIAQLSGLSNAVCGSVKPRKANFDFSQRGAIPALKSVSLLACPKTASREIDLLLLSVGGNDVGFSGLVANAAVTNDQALEALAGMFGKNIKVTIAEANKRSKALKSKYAALAEALKSVVHFGDAAKMVLSAYPVMARTESDENCARGNAGMDVTPFYDMQPARAMAVEAFVNDALTPAMRNAASDIGWVFVEGSRTAFSKRGICAYSEAERANAAWSNLRFPRRFDPEIIVAASPFTKAGTSKSTGRGRKYGSIEPAPTAVRWRDNFEPNLFAPYASRQRWFRTPNDAFLTTHYHDDKIFLSDLVILTRFAAYSGAFHPTAEGHAALADSLLQKARAILARSP